MRRDLFNVGNTTEPNYIFSVGNDSVITGLTDYMTLYNNG